MKKKRHSVKAIMRIVRESDSESVSEVSRKHGVTEQTLYRWRRKYAGMDLANAKRLKQLEDENRQLKEIVADQALNIKVLEHVNSKKTVSHRLPLTGGTVPRTHANRCQDHRTHGGTAPKPPGFFALWHARGIRLEDGGEHEAPRPPYMHCRRRSGRIPAEPYPPRQLDNPRSFPPQFNPIT
jgi:putative transposase